MTDYPKQRIAENDPRYAELDAFLDGLSAETGKGMMALQKAQSLFGYLPLEVHKHISAKTGVSVAELYGVTTFYSQFLTEPQGKHQISVCMGTACYVRGAQKVIEKIQDTLKIKVDQTTSDGMLSLRAARCLGCCGLAPVMMVGEQVYANITNVDKIPGFLAPYQKNESEASDGAKGGQA